MSDTPYLSGATTRSEWKGAEWLRGVYAKTDPIRLNKLSILDSRRLITLVRRQYIGEYETGIPPTVYTLTEEGQALLEG